MSKRGTNGDKEPPASKQEDLPVSTSWPSKYPQALENIKMQLSDDGKSITCLACTTYDNRKASKNGVVYCAREKIFKFDSMLDHVKHEYHASSISRLAIDEDGANLTAVQFYKKYGRKYTKRKKATTMADFFASIPKKSKTVNNNEPSTRNLDKATMEEMEVDSGADDDEIVAIDNVPNGHPPAIPHIDPTVRSHICGGSFSSSDQTNLLIQKGLQLTHH